ncbi:MAG: ABC transporter substrate-binding protein [Candidatus Lambdaproteobacteria bacterium]|nr:ABC transporter substrate-binding protein [Candidatus Lambdaproteobacteria bacterium]
MHGRTLMKVVGCLLLLRPILAGEAAAQKYGGTLRSILRGSPPDLSIHETVWTNATAPISPTYNNLVWFDTFQPKETPDTIVPELAESWSWRNGGTELVFKLRGGVRWHDGKPFTSADVKHTFDVVRGVSAKKLKLNPRKLWYFNVKDVTTRGDREVTFVLGRPQPSVLSILAAGYSPVYPAHVDPGLLRTTSVGTGPFKLKSYVRDQRIDIVKNPDYFVSGRPYLDGVEFYIIKGEAAEIAALLGRQADVGSLLTTPQPTYEQLKAANVGLAFTKAIINGGVNIIVNTKKPPFDNPKLRRAVNLAMDRNSLVRSVFQGGAEPGTAFMPAPYGTWGLTAEQMRPLPGMGDPAQHKAEARRLLAELGYTAEKPLRVKVTTRAIVHYVKAALWVLGELKAVGIDAELDQVDQALFMPKVFRREFDIGVNYTAIGIDDPDANFYETYTCGSNRNYSDYCNEAFMKAVDVQSVETDFAKRRAMVQALDMQLQNESARPYLGYQYDYYAHQSFVKNWIPHYIVYNGWRLTEVWLDK